MTNLEKFLDQNHITGVFCLWYKKACFSNSRKEAWGHASIQALAILEIDAADDLAFVLHMIAERRRSKTPLRRTNPMCNTIHKLTVEKHIENARLQLIQLDYVLAQVAEDLLEEPHPDFDPKKLYRCRDPEFQAVIHYTRADGNHSGSVWQNGNAPFPVSWDSAGRYIGYGHESWDLVNYDNDAHPSPTHQKAAIAKDYRKRLDLRMMIDLGNHMVKQVGDRLLVEAWANAIKNIRDNTGISILPAENRG